MKWWLPLRQRQWLLMLEWRCLSLRWAGEVTVLIKAGVMTANVGVVLLVSEVGRSGDGIH